jgi:hypothetical protein
MTWAYTQHTCRDAQVGHAVLHDALTDGFQKPVLPQVAQQAEAVAPADEDGLGSRQGTEGHSQAGPISPSPPRRGGRPTHLRLVDGLDRVGLGVDGAYCVPCVEPLRPV